MRMKTDWTRYALTAVTALSAALAACEDANPGRIKAQCATASPDGPACGLPHVLALVLPAIAPHAVAQVRRPEPYP